MRYNTVLFDFDGTLADSFSVGLNIYNELASLHGFKVVAEDEVPHFKGLSLPNLLSELKVPKLKLPFLVSKGTKILRSSIDQILPFEGISQVLQTIRPNVENLGVLTSNRVENVESFLSKHDLHDQIDFIESCSKLTGKAKFIRSICKDVGCLPEELVYIGDEERDIKAAHKAGCDIVAVNWGFNSPEALEAERPTYTAKQPSDILKFLGL